MKTILRIIIILLVAAVVAGAFSLAVNNSSTASSSIGQPPAMTSSTQSTTQMARPEGGDRDSGSITQGLAGVANTLMKLTGISILVLLLQKGASQLSNRKLKLAQ